MKHLLCLAFLLVAPLSWAGFTWPAGARPSAPLHQELVEFDGITLPQYRLKLSGIDIEISYLAAFSLGLNDPKWSATFVIAQQPAIRWGATVFNKGEFLPDLGTESLLAYAESLQACGATQVACTADGQTQEDLMISGIKAERVDYVQEGTKTREYLVEVNSKIVVFGYQAPVKLFDEHAEIARVIFSRVRFL